MSGCDRCGHTKKAHITFTDGRTRCGFCGCPKYLKPGTMRMTSETAGETG